MNGLVVMQSVFRGGEFAQIQEGDQVSPGQPFVKVVDTSSMMVDATVNQVEAESLRLGQRGTVEFDAFPGLRLAGRVHSIGAIAVGGWRVNYYIRNVPVRVQIEGSDPRVIPDLSASASIQIDNVEKALVIPLEAVTTERGKHFVEVRTGLLRFARREVTLGLRSNTHAVAVSGVKEGEELAVGRTLLAAAQ
jgi:multidrug efflux pump subunit AcrA (membrane-fusion protein)